jgi:hypothetical protein
MPYITLRSCRQSIIHLEQSVQSFVSSFSFMQLVRWMDGTLILYRRVGSRPTQPTDDRYSSIITFNSKAFSDSFLFLFFV